MRVGSSFHQPGTVNEKVLESDFVPLCDAPRGDARCRSQTSGGDVDCHQWVEVGGCWACGCFICKHQCLELDAGCNRKPVQGDKERFNMCSFGFTEDQSCRCILNHFALQSCRGETRGFVKLKLCYVTTSCANLALLHDTLLSHLCIVKLQNALVHLMHFQCFLFNSRVLFQINCSRAQATVWGVSWKLVGIAIKRVYTFDQNFCPSKTDYFTGVISAMKDVIADVQLTLPQRKLWVCLKYLKPQTSANPVNNCSLHIHIFLLKLIRNCLRNWKMIP